MTFTRLPYGRLRQLFYEFAKFAVIGVTGVFITNAVYGLLHIHLGLGPVTSTTIATIIAAIATYLGNRYWSFRSRQRTGVMHEIVVFAVLNGIGLLIQDAVVAFGYYLLHLGHNRLAGFIALNTGIALATLFRFWSYRQFVWVAPPASGAGDTEGRPRPADRPPQTRPVQILESHAGAPGGEPAWAQVTPEAERGWSNQGGDPVADELDTAGPDHGTRRGRRPDRRRFVGLRRRRTAARRRLLRRPSGKSEAPVRVRGGDEAALEREA